MVLFALVVVVLLAQSRGMGLAPRAGSTGTGSSWNVADSHSSNKFSQTAKHRGVCPANDVMSACVMADDACTRDAECAATEKCCKQGCGRKCVSVSPTKCPPGQVSRRGECQPCNRCKRGCPRRQTVDCNCRCVPNTGKEKQTVKTQLRRFRNAINGDKKFCHTLNYGTWYLGNIAKLLMKIPAAESHGLQEEFEKLKREYEVQRADTERLSDCARKGLGQKIINLKKQVEGVETAQSRAIRNAERTLQQAEEMIRKAGSGQEIPRYQKLIAGYKTVLEGYKQEPQTVTKSGAMICEATPGKSGTRKVLYTCYEKTADEVRRTAAKRPRTYRIPRTTKTGRTRVRTNPVRNTPVRNTQIRRTQIRKTPVRNNRSRKNGVRNTRVRNTRVGNTSVKNTQVRKSYDRSSHVRKAVARQAYVRKAAPRQTSKPQVKPEPSYEGHDDGYNYTE